LSAIVVALTATAVASVLLTTQAIDNVDRWLPLTVALGLLSAIMEFKDVQTARGGRVTATGICHIGLVLIAPPPLPALVVACGVLIEQVARHRPPARLAFNVANHCIALSAASWIATAGDAPLVWLVQRPTASSFALAGLVIGAYYSINTVLTAVVLSLANDRDLWYVLRTNSRSTVVPDLAGATLGVFVAITSLADPQWTVLLALPGALVAKAQSTIRSLEAETIAAVSHLAGTLDARDSSTHKHSSRVAENATKLATALGLNGAQIDLIHLASRVHDLGKVGVTDAVLLKPGPLDEFERAQMQQHPELGATVLKNFGLYREGAALVRSHHERWDGGGYPDHLGGDQIPLGARVIAVADSFDAMTSDRPYRRGMAVSDAVAELERGAGSQWDPRVVRCFVETVLPGLYPDILESAAGTAIKRAQTSGLAEEPPRAIAMG
jgi:HD-GYP domain-containing protein (c-di-GMP phosphodiesterase class II)